jgi:antitoxin (DNA-binding transcriptional repressor) of toxin-antitoxin stability system
MVQLSANEAQDRLPELLGAARAGEIIEIQDNGWTFRLTAVTSRPPVTGTPKAGRLKGQLVVPDDFDEPLEELREYIVLTDYLEFTLRNEKAGGK